MYIPPLELETWFVNIFAGSTFIFIAIAILLIIGMAGFFRMTVFSLSFVLIMFIAMYSEYVPKEIYYLFAIFGSLLAGYWISKMVSR